MTSVRLQSILPILIISLVLFPNKSAQAFDFTLTPLIAEYSEEEATPGTVLEGSVSLHSNQDTASNYIFEVNDFYYDDSGTMVFYENENETEFPDYSMKDWISIDVNEFTLGANESKTVPYTITVPADAKEGGHYAAIFAKQAYLEQTEPTMITSGRLGTLILVTVGKNVDRSAAIEDFYTGPANSDGSYTSIPPRPELIFKQTPINFVIKVRGTGNSYFTLEGEIEIKGEQYTEQIPLSRMKVFPGVPKPIITLFDPNEISPGNYTATLKTNNGYGKTFPDETTTFTIESARSGGSKIDTNTFLYVLYKVFQSFLKSF